MRGRIFFKPVDQLGNIRQVGFAFLSLILTIAVLAFIIGPPALDKPPDPSVLDADPRPDWYLLWYFALLALIPVRIEGYVMILMPVLLGLLLLIIPVLNHKGERAASRRPWAIAVVCLSVIMIGSLWIAGQQSPWSPNFQALPLSEKLLVQRTDRCSKVHSCFTTKPA